MTLNPTPLREQPNIVRVRVRGRARTRGMVRVRARSRGMGVVRVRQAPLRLYDHMPVMHACPLPYALS